MEDKVLCKRKYKHFQIGKFYKIDEKSDYLNRTHVCIEGVWFTAKGYEFIWPNLHDYFFTNQEERNIKLQVIDLKNKFDI